MILYHILIKDCNHVNKTKDMVIRMHICNEFYCSVWFSSNLGILKDKTLSLKFLCLEKALAMTIIVANLLVSKLFKDMELAEVYYYRTFISPDWYFLNLSIDKNKLLMFHNISLFSILIFIQVISFPIYMCNELNNSRLKLHVSSTLRQWRSMKQQKQFHF